MSSSDVVRPTRSQLLGLREAALETSTVGLIGNNRRSIHATYRYPARFSPTFAEAVIQAFSREGDTVVDPYCGGGTTALEATRLGRHAFASDLSPLAAFLARAKGRLYGLHSIAMAERWSEDCLSSKYNDLRLLARDARPPEAGLGALDAPELRSVRDALGAWQAMATDLGPATDLARLSLLRCGQRVLDLRKDLPNLAVLRAALRDSVDQTIAASMVYQDDVRDAWPHIGRRTYRVRELGAQRIATSRGVGTSAAALALFSPPYAGVHVLYPRWQVQGRRETAAPFWLAGVEGDTRETTYTMGRRGVEHTDEYMAAMKVQAAAIAQSVQPGGYVVQMVGFKDADHQLPLFLRTMSAAGLSEKKYRTIATGSDGRLWRSVPGQRWYSAVRDAPTPASREVVLIHQRTPRP